MQPRFHRACAGPTGFKLLSSAPQRMLTLGTVSGSWTTPDDKPLHAGDPSLPRRQDPGGLVEVGGRGLTGDGMLAAHGTMLWVHGSERVDRAAAQLAWRQPA